MNVAARRIAALYDPAVPGWPGEIEFCRGLAAQSAGGLLEVGCGTGRVTLRLEELATTLVGLDISAAMLEVARSESRTIRWVEGDLRAFDLGETFGQILIPGHSFQHVLTAEDQVGCLKRLLRYLSPGGTLVAHLDHQDLHWLAGLPSAAASKVGPAPDIPDPKSGHRFAVRKAGAFELSGPTATVVGEVQETGERGERLGLWRTEPLRLHCVFRLEMEHALHRAGLEALEVFGDYERGPLQDEGREILWPARRPAELSRPARAGSPLHPVPPVNPEDHAGPAPAR